MRDPGWALRAVPLLHVHRSAVPNVGHAVTPEAHARQAHLTAAAADLLRLAMETGWVLLDLAIVTDRYPEHIAFKLVPPPQED